MKQIQNQIVARLQSLVCPPEGIPVTGGIQLPEGNSYPDTSDIDLNKHVAGEATYAIDVVYKVENGMELCKWGVIDIDENGDEGFDKALMIRDHLKEEGISTEISFSGRKGFHVYMFTEPVPKDLMVDVLKKIKRMLPFHGEIIPGEGRRCKPAPCLHQVVRQMSYLISDQGQPYSSTFNIGNLPDGFYERQLEILNEITPTPVNLLVVYASKDHNLQHQRDKKDMTPDLSQEDGYIPPCICKLVENGGSAELGTYDKNNLTLMGFCVSKGLSPEKGLELAQTMAKNAENGPVVTEKNYDEKINHFNGIAKSPSVTGTPFNCAFVLRAKKELKYDCAECKVRPKGVKVGFSDERRLDLEIPIAKDLMAYIIQNGRPVEHIAPEVMPSIEYKSSLLKNEPLTCSAYTILLQAIGDGATSNVSIAQWLDRNIRNLENLADYFQLDAGQLSEKLNKHHTNFTAFFTEFKNKILILFDTLSKAQLVDEDLFKEMLDRAIDLTRRYFIAEKSRALTKDSYDANIDILTANSEYTHESNQMLAGSEQGALVPIIEKAQFLLDYITGAGSGITLTPFTELNALLGGGFMNKCLYLLVSPPGGGKSTLACQIADHAAALGIPVIFISMEMSIEQIFINSMARFAEINSAKIMSPFKDIKTAVEDEVACAAEAYLEGIGNYLHVIEGDCETTPARIETMISMVRAKFHMTKQDPLLVVIDYLQLLSTGKEFLDTSPNETFKISELAVRCKQLARDSSVAVLAISDITKDEQQKNYASKEFTLNALRGSNRIGHAADAAIALYSESSEADGGKAKQDPWDLYVSKVGDSERAQEFLESVGKAKKNHKIGGEGATAYARLELMKNRAGQGRGSQFLLYHRAYHKFEPVTLAGQAKAEGRA